MMPRKPIQLHGKYIRRETWKSGKVITARDQRGHLVTWSKLKNTKGGFQGAVFNFNRIQSFKSIKENPKIVEKHTYLNGITRKGEFVRPGELVPSKPSATNIITIQYVIKALFKDGRSVYGSSLNVNRHNLSEDSARKQALRNLYKNVSAEYSDNYGEDVGKAIVAHTNPTILHGWATYYGKKRKATPV